MIIIGCGDVGQGIAQHFLSVGEPVSGIVRSQKTAQRVEAIGANPVEMNLDDQLPDEKILQHENIFYLLPPPKIGIKDSRIRRLLPVLGQAIKPRRIVLISTTGVYGPCLGEWIDESRAVNPQADRAKRRLDAELALKKWAAQAGSEFIILRVASIYGPNRLPIKRLQIGSPVARREEAPWTNRIHRDDLVNVCVAAMEKGRHGEVYNICDGNPGNMTDYFNAVADFSGINRPPTLGMNEIKKKVSPDLMNYLQESRRIKNQKMLNEFEVKLQYPNLEAGLQSCRYNKKDR